MIKPADIDETVWSVISAAAAGDVETLRKLLAEDPARSREGYWYTPPIHFAVREGHAEAVKLLLDSGADCEWNGYHGSSLIGMARERGHDAVVRLLEQALPQRGRVGQSASREDREIHIAAQNGDVRRVRKLLDADPRLAHLGDANGGTPLHRAVASSSREVVKLLLDRGADVHAVHGTGEGASHGFWAQDIQAIDIAIWGRHGASIPRRRPPIWRIAIACVRYFLFGRRRQGMRPCDEETARLLLARGASHDLTIASALGDFDRVKEILDAEPARISEVRSSGRRPLTVAMEFGYERIARFLLERGADPTWREINADRGGALHIAAGAGNQPMVELLLRHGADPNGHIDSSGNALFAAKTPEIRALLERHGGRIDPFDLVWKDEDDEVMRQVTEDPQSADRGCGGVFTAVVTRGKRDLLKRLIDAGIRVPRVLTGCQSYVLEQPDMLQTLLQGAMHPDTCNWQHQTMLHQLCGPDPEGKAVDLNTKRAAMLLDAGASILERDDEYRSTPLAWAARNNNPGMVKFLLERGSPTQLPDDKPWATPLAWATRRGHTEIVRILRDAGATP